MVGILNSVKLCCKYYQKIKVNQFYRENIPAIKIQNIKIDSTIPVAENENKYVSCLEEDDEFLNLVIDLHKDGYSGVIFQVHQGLEKVGMRGI